MLETEQRVWTHFEEMVCDARRIIMVRNPTRCSSFRLVERGSVGVHSGAPQQLPPPDVLGNSPRECLGGEGLISNGMTAVAGCTGGQDPSAHPWYRGGHMRCVAQLPPNPTPREYLHAPHV